MKNMMIIMMMTLMLGSLLNADSFPEIGLQEIELQGVITDRNSELSGMTWYKDHLILLPQYPNFPTYKNEGRLFKIPKNKLLKYVVGDVTLPVEPEEIKVDISFFQSSIPGFEGFEAIAFEGNRVFLTIESEPEKIIGFLIQGVIDLELTEVILDTLSIIEIDPQADVSNACEESLIYFDNKIVTIYEANGKNINPEPVAHVFDLEADTLSTIKFPNIEYRITDVTLIDEKGKFWGINYFWPGEKDEYKPALDVISERFGKGESHAGTEVVERIIEFRFQQGEIYFSGVPPVVLKLDSDARNLEGIVRFDNLGFLLCTDKFPRTILGFVPHDFED
jgi:hypothetical protein